MSVKKRRKKRDHIQLFPTSAVEAKGVYKQRIRTAPGHAAHRGWARLLLDRRRGLIVHGPRATRNAGGKFDDEEQQGKGADLRHPSLVVALHVQQLLTRRADF